jgi:molybdate transport system ATP-binding protein
MPDAALSTAGMHIDAARGALAGRCRFTLASRGLDAALDIAARGITGLFGPSGGGKTTLLRCIAGLEPQARGYCAIGEVVWQDDAYRVFVPAAQRAVGYVFQESRLFPHLTVDGNLRYGWQRNRHAPAVATYEQVLALLDLAPLLPRRPHQLSGGEMQRVAIGRALLRAPRVLLLDEPLANLDIARKQEILPFLDRLHGTLALPIVYVSHNLDEITRLCDDLVVLQAGGVRAAGALNDVLTGTDLPLLAGDEACAVLDGRIAEFDARYEMTGVAYSGGTLYATGRHGAVGSAVRLRILARDVSLCRTRPVDTTIVNILPATVEAISAERGAYANVRVRVGRDVVLAKITRRSVETLGLGVGQAVFAQIKGVAVKEMRALTPALSR